MGVQYPKDSEYAKEVVKWEAESTDFGKPGRPYVRRDFPMTVHKAGRREGVTPAIVETKQVGDEAEQTREQHEGFYTTPLEALEAFHRQDLEIAKLAAERHENERRMSRQAQAEGHAADEADGAHVASVPTTPIKPKPAAPAAR